MSALIHQSLPHGAGPTPYVFTASHPDGFVKVAVTTPHAFVEERGEIRLSPTEALILGAKLVHSSVKAETAGAVVDLQDPVIVAQLREVFASALDALVKCDGHVTL